MPINNGERLPVKFGDFDGIAGIAVRRNGDKIVSIPGKLRNFKAQRGEIDGIEHLVLSAKQSDYNSDVINVTVERA